MINVYSPGRHLRRQRTKDCYPVDRRSKSYISNRAGNWKFYSYIKVNILIAYLNKLYSLQEYSTHFLHSVILQVINAKQKNYLFFNTYRTASAIMQINTPHTHHIYKCKHISCPFKLHKHSHIHKLINISVLPRFKHQTLLQGLQQVSPVNTVVA